MKLLDKGLFEIAPMRLQGSIDLVHTPRLSLHTGTAIACGSVRLKI